MPLVSGPVAGATLGKLIAPVASGLLAPKPAAPSTAVASNSSVVSANVAPPQFGEILRPFIQGSAENGGFGLQASRISDRLISGPQTGEINASIGGSGTLVVVLLAGLGLVLFLRR